MGSADSIERRFAAAIAYLEHEDAAGAWGRYIDESAMVFAPAWRWILEQVR